LNPKEGKAKRVNKLMEVIFYSLKHAILHPRTTIPARGNPIKEPQSPIPWWGSILVLMIGIASWCAGSCLNITGLDEAGRAMVYLPLGSIFGMAVKAR
jgi:hypothetical protein